MPIGYHGRSATVVPADAGAPPARPEPPGPRRAAVFGPSAKLDVELELGFVVGTPSAMGEPVAVDRALDHVFGVVLLNDWSARDLQAFESQPLGPVPRQVVRDLDLAVGHADGGARAVPRRAVRAAGAGAAAYLREEPWALDIALEIELNGERVARDERPPPVLERRPADRPPDGQRRRDAHRRPARLGDDLGPGARGARQPARALVERRRAARARGRRERDVPRGRRRGRPARAGGPATRRWRSPRCAAGSWARRCPAEGHPPLTPTACATIRGCGRSRWAPA
jgi:hypothetical protein